MVKYLETKYTQLENSYYVHIDTTEMMDQRSVMISIRSIEGFRRGDYDMITNHIEDLMEDEYRRRKRRQKQDKKREEKIKETIPIDEEAVAFVIGKGKSNIKRICGKFKDSGVYIECPKRGSGSSNFTILARSEKVINDVIEMLLESEEMALKKQKKNKQKENESSENEEEIKITPEPEPKFKPTFDETNKWGDDI